MESLDCLQFNFGKTLWFDFLGGKMKLSVAMITCNEEKILEKTLKSVASLADEIVIVDSGSTDRTEEIALKYGAKFVHQDWLGYGPQRNKAIDLCKSEWILNIDADEVVSPELLEKISQVVKKEGKEKVYKVLFTAICFGKKIYHGGWSGAKKVRLFYKGAGKFNDNIVHENFETGEAIGVLNAEIYHYTYENIEDYFYKFNRYTTEAAAELFRKGKKSKKWKIFLEPFYKFLYNYIFRLGFLDGLEGFVLASTTALYSMVKYYKLYELTKSKKGSNSVK